VARRMQPGPAKCIHVTGYCDWNASGASSQWKTPSTRNSEQGDRREVGSPKLRWSGDAEGHSESSGQQRRNGMQLDRSS
jgi:hypothetical protein